MRRPEDLPAERLEIFHCVLRVKKAVLSETRVDEERCMPECLSVILVDGSSQRPWNRMPKQMSTSLRQFKKPKSLSYGMIEYLCSRRTVILSPRKEPRSPEAIIPRSSECTWSWVSKYHFLLKKKHRSLEKWQTLVLRQWRYRWTWNTLCRKGRNGWNQTKLMEICQKVTRIQQEDFLTNKTKEKLSKKIRTINHWGGATKQESETTLLINWW